MELVEHIEVLRTEGMLLADSAEATGFEAQVPTCPEWTVRDLVRHVGEVHRWAHSHVAQARPTLNTESFAIWPAEDKSLLPWYREGHAQLLQALEAADPEADYFSFLPGPKGTRFWARRQAHETAIHRVDAQSVTGMVGETTADFAADGIGEILNGFFARRPSRVTSAEPYSFELVCTDSPQSWRVKVDGDGPAVVDASGPADCRISGTTFDLYLLLWNRRPLDGLDVQGSPAGLDHWRENARVRWG